MVKPTENDRLCTKSKYTKAEVKYGPSDDPCKHSCGICTYHLHVPGTNRLECGIVEGKVKANDGCKLFDINLIKAATSK